MIIAAGPWSAALARLAGLELPIVPVLHEYFVTEPVPGWHGGLPCLRIPEVQVYARGESNRVLCGGFENRGTSIDPREVSVASRLRGPAGLGRARRVRGQPEPSSRRRWPGRASPRRSRAGRRSARTAGSSWAR